MTDQIPPPPAYEQGFQELPPPARTGSGLALGSLITGIASLLLCGLGIIGGPIAVVLGIMSGRRSGYGGKQIVGIITGVLAFLVSAGALVEFLLFLSGRDDERFIQPPVVVAESADPVQATPDVQPTTEVQEPGFVLSEQGVAGSEFDTAYAAYLHFVGVSHEFDGMYDGSLIDTPCFTLEGEPWWVVQGSTESCAPSSELWWEMAQDSEEPEIAAFGWGEAGAAISFEPVSTELLMRKVNSTDLQPLADYARDILLPQSGATNIIESQITLGGMPAVQFDCTFEHLDSYRFDVVMLPKPVTLDDGTEIRGFIIHAYNADEWVYKSEDVFTRLDKTLKWK